MPVKVLGSDGSGTYTGIAEGIYYAADNGAKVISMSLGGGSPSTILEDALAYAYAKGVTIICAAGNDGSDTLVSYPAAYDQYCIAVGATRYDDEVAYYSNKGPALDITAPGGDITVDQDGNGYGDGILQQTFDSSPTDFGYWYYQGTSMATPHVSGVAALLIASGVATTPDEVREVLQTTARDAGAPGYDTSYGWGILDAYAALTYSAEPNGAPVAVVAGPTSGTEGDALVFDGSSSYDPDGDALTYAWEFGDGGVAAGANPSHVYTEGGVFSVSLVVNDGKADSAADSMSVSITAVDDPPVADAGGPYAAMSGEAITFDGSQSYDPEGETLSYSWDFGDGSSGSGVAPTHSYSAGGTYTATLIVNDGNADSAPATASVSVSQTNIAPVADTGGPYYGTEDVPVVFNGGGSYDLNGDALTYAWTFGDGASGTGETPTHTYTSGGTYTVTLVVNDGSADSDPAADLVTISAVNDTPVADAGGPYNGAEGVAVSFDGSGSTDADGDALTYSWSFGDGSTGTGVAPSHTYASTGTYTVTLTVNDGTVDSSPSTAQVTISAVNSAPVADAGGPYSGDEGVAVTFNGSGSSDADGDVLTYNWTFGDGGTGTGVAPSHTYAAAGTYTVTLTVNDGTVDSSPAQAQVTIAAVNEAPVADAGSDVSATTGESISFSGSGSYDPDGDALTYSWSFGDGSSASGVTASHSYASAGTYQVVLTVTDPSGASDSDLLTVSVTDSQVATLSVGNIDMQLVSRTFFRSSMYYATATVTIVDDDGSPVSGATVSGRWSGAATDSDTGITDSSGRVTLRSNWVFNAASGSSFSFTVNSVSSSGLTYDPAANQETTDTVVVP